MVFEAAPAVTEEGVGAVWMLNFVVQCGGWIPYPTDIVFEAAPAVTEVVVVTTIGASMGTPGVWTGPC